jgi:hypothetical protein
MPQHEATRCAYERIAGPSLERERQMLGRLLDGPERWARYIEATERDRAILDRILGLGVGRRLSIDATDLGPALRAQHVLQPYLDELVGLLDQTALGRERPGPPMYVGVLPADSFNAEARLTSEGVVVLVNTGLLVLVARIATVSAMAIRTESLRFEAPLFTAADVVAELAKVLVAVTFEGRASAAPPPPLLDSERSAAASAIGAGIVLFVIAHELGHIAAGHVLNDATSIDFESCGPGSAGRSTAEEISADAHAAKLIKRVAASLSLDTRDEWALAGGGVSFLSIWTACERARLSLTDRERTPAHTSGAVFEIGARRDALRTHAESGLDTPDEPGAAFETWLGAVTDLALETVVDTVGTARERQTRDGSSALER